MDRLNVVQMNKSEPLTGHSELGENKVWPVRLE